MILENNYDTEQALDKKIMLYCGSHDWLCFHANVGKVKLADGRFFSTGLPVGFPDLIIIKKNGEICFCETKIHPRKPTKEQENFINCLKNRGFNAFVAYSLNEFIALI